MKDVKRVNVLVLVSLIFSTFISYIGLLSAIRGFAFRQITAELVINLPLLCFIFICLYAKRNGEYPEGFSLRKDLLNIKLISLKDFLICALLGISFPRVLELINLISQLFTENKVNATAQEMCRQGNPVSAVFALGIFPAIVEELANRGILMGIYRKQSVWEAIILNSLIFAMFHGNLNQVLYAFFAGIFFSLLVEATGSIVSSFIVHMVINTSTVVKAFVMYSGTQQSGADIFAVEESGIISSLPVYLVLAAAGGIISFFLFRWLARGNGRWDYIKDLFRGRSREPAMTGTLSMRSLFTAPLILYLVIQTYNIVVNELISHGILNL